MIQTRCPRLDAPAAGTLCHARPDLPSEGRPRAPICPGLESIDHQSTSSCPDHDLSFCFGIQNLAAAVFARLEVDVVRTTAFTAFLILNIAGRGQCVVRPALTTLHGRHLTAWNCHLTCSKYGGRPLNREKPHD